MQNFYFSCNLCPNYKAGLTNEYNVSQHLIIHHMGKDLSNLASFVSDCKFSYSLIGSLGTSFFKLLGQLRAQIDKSVDLDHRLKLLSIMDLFLLPPTDDFEKLINTVLNGGTVQEPFVIPNCVGDMATYSSTKRFRANDGSNLPMGFFEDLNACAAMGGGACALETLPSDLVPQQSQLMHNFAQPILVGTELASNLPNFTDVDTYLRKREEILKSRTDFLFEKIKKMHDCILRRTAELDCRERRLIEDRSSFESDMLSRRQMLASDDMESSLYLSKQLSESLTLSYSTFSGRK